MNQQSRNTRKSIHKHFNEQHTPCTYLHMLFKETHSFSNVKVSKKKKVARGDRGREGDKGGGEGGGGSI